MAVSEDAVREERELEDLREQVRMMRAQLTQTEKLAALGALTAGVAHELNNPIGYVKINTSMLSDYLGVMVPVLRQVVELASAGDDEASTLRRIRSAVDPQELAAILDDIEPLLADTQEGALRVEEIVSSLRSFARADGESDERFDLNQCVRDTLKVAWNELKYKAEVIQSLEDIPLLLGKPGALSQVILNLLVNAAQAMSEFGEIRIGTCRVGEEVELSVADSGRGIADADLGRIFAPYFTTKPPGKGTGLGLSISRDIVVAHGGRIEVQSEPGSGTVFRVLLPLGLESLRDNDA